VPFRCGAIPPTARCDEWPNWVLAWAVILISGQITRSAGSACRQEAAGMANSVRANAGLANSMAGEACAFMREERQPKPVGYSDLQVLVEGRTFLIGTSE